MAVDDEADEDHDPNDVAIDDTEARQRDESAAHDAILTAMSSDAVRARAVLALAVTKMGARVVKEAETSARNMSPLVMNHLQAWFHINTRAHDETEDFIAAELGVAGLKLAGSVQTQVRRLLEIATESADDKIRKHLQDKSCATEFKLLEPFRRRQLWAESIDRIREFRLPVERGASLVPYFEDPVSSELLGQCSLFNGMMDRWRAVELPVDCVDDGVVFWTRLHAQDENPVPLVTKAALRALCIVLSNTAAERSFSVLRNLEINNRVHAGARYARNMMMLNCNRSLLATMIAKRAKALTACCAPALDDTEECADEADNDDGTCSSTTERSSDSDTPEYEESLCTSTEQRSEH